MGTMHAGRIETSKRMQDLLAFLKERGEKGATGLEIAERLKCLNPPTEVSALRKRLRESGQGDIPPAKHDGTTPSGNAIYRYWLAQFAPKETA